MAYKGWVCENISETAWCKLTCINADMFHRLIRYHFWKSLLDIVFLFQFASVCTFPISLEMLHFARGSAVVLVGLKKMLLKQRRIYGTNNDISIRLDL